DPRPTEVLPVQHHANRVDGRICPPVGRLDLIHYRRLCRGQLPGDAADGSGPKDRPHHAAATPRRASAAATSPGSLTRSTSNAAMPRKTPPATTAIRRLLPRKCVITQPKPNEAMISGITMKKLKIPM